MENSTTEEIRSLQKKFIPANIITAILAFATAVCIMIMPWLDLRLRISGTKVAEMLNDMPTSSASSSEGGEGEAFVDALTEALDGVEFTIPVNLYPLKMLKAATGSEEDVSEFFNSMIGADGAALFIEDFINTLAPAVITATVNMAIETAIDEAVKESGKELTPEQEQQIQGYKQDVNSFVQHLTGENPDTDKAREEFNQLVTKIAADQGETPPDTEELNKAFDELLEMGANPEKNGQFDLMYLLENFDVESFGGESSEDSSSGVEPAAFLLTAASSESGDGNAQGGENAENPENSLKQILDILKDPGSIIVDAIGGEDGSNVDLIQTLLLAVFAVMAGLPAAAFALLGLCAILRIFMQKKRVHTWYAKGFGFWSAIGVIGGNLAPGLIVKFVKVPMLVSVLNACQITFLGSGVIAGACWAALVLLGWFYYRPIKKKIKRLSRGNE